MPKKPKRDLRLAGRALSKVQRRVGPQLARAWQGGDGTTSIVTLNHRHGLLYKATNKVHWFPPETTSKHYASCPPHGEPFLYPDDPSVLTDEQVYDERLSGAPTPPKRTPPLTPPRWLTPPTTRCSSNKARFNTELEADAAVAYWRGKRGHEPGAQVPDHSYPCEECGGHHLTSWTRAQYAGYLNRSNNATIT